jgi:hypothetical protein
VRLRRYRLTRRASRHAPRGVGRPASAGRGGGRGALLGIAPRLAEAEDEGATLTVFDGDDERHPGFLLDRPSWRRGDVVVGVALRWERAQLLDLGGNVWPYVGVRVVSDGR